MKYICLVVILFLCTVCAEKNVVFRKYKDTNCLIVIDKKADPELIELKKLKRSDIVETEVVPPNEFTTRTYGEQAVNGSIFIYTKFYNKKRAEELRSKLIEIIDEYEKSDEPYLFILNGIICNFEQIKNLNQENLTAIEKLELKIASAIYGDLAKKNTILITTKN